MKKSIIIILLFFFSVVLSCSSEEETPEIMTPVESGKIDDFPNEIGSQWTYFYYDSLNNQSDTVIVTIVGNTTDGNNKNLTMWQYKFSAFTDTQYVHISADTVTIYQDSLNLWSYTNIVFPLEIGKSWADGFYSFTVIDTVSIDIAAGHFKNCYLIQQVGGGLNLYINILWWLVPKVGIVKKYYRESGFGFEKNYWELMEYQLTK
jgi:hypothetical protein